VLYGSNEWGLTPIRLKSSSNTFNDILPGVSIDVKAVTSQPVRVTVAENDDAAVDAVNDLVDAFNGTKDYISTNRSYNQETGATGLLCNASSVRMVERTLNNLINTPITDTGSTFRTLGELGIKPNGTGKLSFDESAFRSKLVSD